MAEKILIPDLLVPHLMEFGVCGSLRTRNPKQLKALKLIAKERTAIVSHLTRDATQYVQLGGGGNVKNHLHVDVVVRPRSWKSKSDLSSISTIENAIEQFVGAKAKLITRGEFLLEISTLPKKSFLREAMKGMTVDGAKARVTSGHLAMESGGPLRRVVWSLFSKDSVVVALHVVQDGVINLNYLQDCKASVLRTFRTVILGD
jgi:hypothetical protein